MVEQEIVDKDKTGYTVLYNHQGDRYDHSLGEDITDISANKSEKDILDDVPLDLQGEQPGDQTIASLSMTNRLQSGFGFTGASLQYLNGIFPRKSEGGRLKPSFSSIYMQRSGQERRNNGYTFLYGLSRLFQESPKIRIFLICLKNIPRSRN